MAHNHASLQTAQLQRCLCSHRAVKQPGGTVVRFLRDSPFVNSNVRLFCRCFNVNNYPNACKSTISSSSSMSYQAMLNMIASENIGKEQRFERRSCIKLSHTQGTCSGVTVSAIACGGRTSWCFISSKTSKKAQITEVSKAWGFDEPLPPLSGGERACVFCSSMAN
eukprot:1474657-Amphidinium_carterae.3